MKSILSNEKWCYICGDTRDIHQHHIFGGPNRKHSDKHGLWVYLCAKHHNFSDEGVHYNKLLADHLHREGQKAFERNHSREEFMAIFGRNYL